MKYLFPKVLIILLLTLSFCTKTYDVEELKTKIDAMNDIFVKAMMENDNDAFLALYAEDGISLPSYEPMMIGLEAMKKAVEKSEQNPMKVTKFSLTTKEVFTSGNLVVDVGTYTISMEMPGNPMPIDDKGKYVNIFEIQEDGSLKIKVDTWNTDINPWEMMGDMGDKMPEPKKKKKMN
jgi:ketosteroid isomerase-like protein